MSLSQFNFIGRSVQELQSWFVDVYNHLSAKNYDNGEWTPVCTGLSGTPEIKAWFQRFGKKCDFTVYLDGPQAFTNGTITLPLLATGDGYASIINGSDGSFLGIGLVNETTQRIEIKSYWVPDETILIQGAYRIAGI